MGPSFLRNFPSQLRYWALHGALNSAPSLAIAWGWLRVGWNPPVMAAIASAVLLFVLAGACLTSVPGPLSHRSHALNRAVRLTLTLRAWLICLTLPLLLSEQSALFVPDAWCGGLAMLAQYQGARLLRLPFEFSGLNFSHAGFLQVFALAVIEGLILSILLLILATLILLILQRRDRRRGILPTAGRPM